MKHRVREAVFNMLGPAVEGKHVFDLFAGTGALGLEAVSRGAARATLVERHGGTAEQLRRHVERLGAAARVTVVADDVFRWASRPWPARPDPWLVFCCPPYAHYAERAEAMDWLLRRLCGLAPAGSVLVVEAPARWDVGRLPDAQRWRIRAYPPALIALLEVERRAAEGPTHR